MRIKYLVTLIILLLSNMVNAGTWENRRSNLNQVVIYNQYRIFYALTGKDALPNKSQSDTNKNGIPDFIENVGRRLAHAEHIFKHKVGLTPPLKSKRYIGKAHYIDINILDFSNNKKGPKNGVAYDGTPKFNRTKTGQASLNVLAIDLSGSLRLKTNSVEHELFHLYQNGYTFFKNRWYTEGTARWSELIINGRIGRGEPLPNSKNARNSLFNKTYAADVFWNELIIRLDKNTQGRNFIKALLEELDYADNKAANTRGLNHSHWKESEQRSTDNNIYIWKTTLKVIQRLENSLDSDVKKLFNI